MPQLPKTKKASKGTQYSRGRRKEWQLAAQLKEDGWEVVRSAGSHGLWDLCAAGYGKVWFMQVKYSLNGHFKHDANMRDLEALEVPPGAFKWVVTYTRGSSVPFWTKV